MCKQWWNGPMCQKKIKFISLLPFNPSKHSVLAERIATIQLCVSCPYRMFVLPKYAVDHDKVEQYSLLWRNRNILAALYGEKDETEHIRKEIGALVLASIRRKKIMTGLGRYSNVRA